MDRDGVALFYEKADGGDTPFLLVHGIACDHAYLAPHFEHFERAGHRVVSVDLSGHGRSGAPDGDYTMEMFAGDRRGMPVIQELRRGLSGPYLPGAAGVGSVLVFVICCSPVVRREPFPCVMARIGQAGAEHLPRTHRSSRVL